MEYFDILTEDGRRTGKVKERSAVHRDGDWHGSVHIWILRQSEQGLETLLQRRSSNKDSYPGLLDAACTGHVDAGEDFPQAAARELAEELNLHIQVSDLQFLFSQKEYVNEVYCDIPFISREINYVYLLHPSVDLSSLRFLEEEIDELVWLSCEKIDLDLREGRAGSYCLIPEEFRRVCATYSIGITPG